MLRFEIETQLGIWQERLAKAHDDLEEAEARVKYYRTELDSLEETEMWLVGECGLEIFEKE